MIDADFLIIAQSDSVDYSKYSTLPMDRLPLFKNLVYPRMLRYDGAFVSHVDLLNILSGRPSFAQASCEERAGVLNIWNLPSFSGMHLANYLLEADITTHVINNFDAEWDSLLAEGLSSRRLLVGISTTFYLNWTEIKRLVRAVKRSLPDADIVLGGAFIYEQKRVAGSESVARTMHKYGIRYALHAVNSEHDLKDLLLWHKQGGVGTPPVSNVIVTGDDGVSFQETPEVWHPPLLGCRARYHELSLPFLNTTVQLRASAGCCFNCAFCTYPNIAKGYHPNELENIREQLESILQIGSVKNVIFIDDTLNVPPKRFKEFLRLLIPYKLNWFSFLRVQFVDEETAQLMAESGCMAVYLGIESASDAVLKNMNKKAKRAEYLEGVRLLRKYGISCMAAFIVGFPGETAETLRENIDFIRTSGIDFYTLKEFFLIEGTEIDKRRNEYGLTGMHSNWSHSTMNSTQAYEHKMSMFDQIGQDCIFIDPDTSMWYLAYLFDQGFSLELIAEIQKNINEVTAEQVAGQFDDKHPAFERIRNLLKSDGGNV